MINIYGKKVSGWLVCICTLSISACQYLPEFPAQSSTVQEDSSEPQQSGVQEKSEVSDETFVTEARPVNQEIREIGTGQFIASQPQSVNQVDVDATAGDITLNFQNTDIREFIKVILADILNLNYIIDQNVNGQVTIETTQPITRNKVLPLFENILEMNNAALISTPEEIYKIVPKPLATRSNLSPIVTTTSQGGHSLRIVPLQYISALEMNKILEPIISEGVQITVDQKRNLLIVSGNTPQFTSIQDTINLFDVEWLRGMSVGLYPLKFVDPETMTNELNTILTAMEGGEVSEGMLGGLVRIVPLERLNSILIISQNATALREVELWMYRLDRPGDHVGKRLYVYNVQNAKATDLADILGHIFTSTSDTTSARTIDSTELAPGLTPVEIRNSVSSNQEQSRENTESEQPNTQSSNDK